MERNKIAKVQELAEKLLSMLDIAGQVAVSEDEENEALVVQIETGEAGVLIGYHGETVSSFQMILGMIANRQLGEWARVLVNVGDYRQKREETLTRMALNAAQKAHFSGQPVILSSLSSADRRIIHMVLKDHKEVETYSEGEGRERKLIIKPR